MRINEKPSVIIANLTAIVNRAGRERVGILGKAMNALQTDTIAALATPAGRSSVAMFRISGPEAFAVCDRILAHRRPTHEYSTQTLHRGIVTDNCGMVDDVLVGVFHGPRSYTGEDVAEITCHGGAVPIRRILARILSCGARPAEPGEFTLRAYLNGKLDLAQAEAVCDLIDARTVCCRQRHDQLEPHEFATTDCKLHKELTLSCPKLGS